MGKRINIIVKSFFLQNFFKADNHLEPLLGIDLLRNAQHAARASWLYSRCGASTDAPTFDGNVFGFTETI